MGCMTLGLRVQEKKMEDTLTPPPVNPLVCPLVDTFINAEDRLSIPLHLGACFASSSNPVLFSLKRASQPS